MTKYINIANGKTYTRTSKKLINTTKNNSLGKIMICYFNQEGQLFVKEEEEFFKGFTKVA